MLFIYEYHVWCLMKSGEQNHTIECGTGHSIVAILLDFTHLSFRFVLSILTSPWIH